MPTQSEISLNPTSTKGAILTSEGSSRSSFAAGTNGQILSAQSSASSGLEYKTFSTSGPAFELIASSVISASTASVIFSNIDTAVSYTSFRLIMTARTTNASGGYTTIRFNNVTSTTYDYGGWYSANASLAATLNGSNRFFDGANGNSSDTNVFTHTVLEIFPEANGMSNRNLQWLYETSGWFGAATTAGTAEFVRGMGRLTGTTDPLSTVSILPVDGSGNPSALAAGSSIYLYGFRR
jgi:hypothetical protein